MWWVAGAGRRQGRGTWRGGRGCACGVCEKMKPGVASRGPRARGFESDGPGIAKSGRDLGSDGLSGRVAGRGLVAMGRGSQACAAVGSSASNWAAAVAGGRARPEAAVIGRNSARLL